MSHRLQVIIGDPASTRASFSRFIFPFAWSRASIAPESPPNRFFRPATAGDRIHGAEADGPKLEADEARLRYFTPETAELLYRRASWWVLDHQSADGIWKTLAVISGLEGASHSYSVAIRPPALVLFEDTSNASAVGRDPLRTGYLILEAMFPEDSEVTFEDVLRFNEIFRYARCPYAKHATSDVAGPELKSIAKAWHGPDAVEADTAALYEKRWLDLLDTPLRGRDGVFFKVAPTAVREVVEFPVNPDDRAFTQSAVFVRGGVEPDGQEPQGKPPSPTGIIADAFQPEIAGEDLPPGAGHWVAHLNVDRPSRTDSTAASCSRFEYKWALERTYKRWLHYGTLYGFTQHSMALMAGDVDDVARDGPQGDPPLAQHMAGLYFDSTLLLLHIRVTLFRFSKEFHDLCRKTGEDPESGENKDWQTPFGKVRWQFLRFVNLYQFPMISTQQQSLEMYELQRLHMDIAELSAELDQEIRNSDEVLNQRLDGKRNDEALQLNKIAYYGLMFSIFIAGLTASVVCVQTANVIPDRCKSSPAVAMLGGIGFFFLTLIFATYLCTKRNKPDKSP